MTLGGVESALRVRALSIDPTGEVLAMLVPGSPTPGAPDSTLNTIVLRDLRTGAERGRFTLPWRSLIGSFWLGPGGHSALLVEAPADESGVVRQQIALTSVRLTGATTRQVVADGISDVAMSADWSTVAVTIRDRGGERARVRVLDTASLRPVAPLLTLHSEERNGSIALDAIGSVLTLSWRTGVRDVTDTDIKRMAELQPQVTIWSLPTGIRTDSYRYGSGWRAVVSLGRGVDGPIVLMHTSTIGVVLPASGKPPPLQRLGEDSRTSRRDSASDVMDRLCVVLADPNTDDAVRPLVPRDAYQEDLCPS